MLAQKAQELCFIDNGYAQLLRFRQLAACFRTGYNVIGFFAYAARNLCANLLRHGLCRCAVQRWHSAGKHHGFAVKRMRRVKFRRFHFHIKP